MTEQGEIFAPLMGHGEPRKKIGEAKKIERPEKLLQYLEQAVSVCQWHFLKNMERGEKERDTKSALFKRSPVWAGLPKLGEA